MNELFINAALTQLSLFTQHKHLTTHYSFVLLNKPGKILCSSERMARIRKLVFAHKLA